MKTYEERINLIAEEMAKDTWLDLFGTNDFEKFSNDEMIQAHTPYARIALKHMAEAYAEGHEQGTVYPHIDINLQSLGLQPQTETI